MLFRAGQRWLGVEVENRIGEPHDVLRVNRVGVDVAHVGVGGRDRLSLGDLILGRLQPHVPGIDHLVSVVEMASQFGAALVFQVTATHLRCPSSLLRMSTKAFQAA